MTCENTSGQGNLEIIMGCMWSGKTSELLRRVKRHVSINRNVILVNNSLDTRYDNEAHVTSHDGIQIKTKPAVKSISAPYQLLNASEFTPLEFKTNQDPIR